MLKIIINEVYGLRKLRTNARFLVDAQKDFKKTTFDRKKILERKIKNTQAKLDNLLEYCVDHNVPGEKYKELNAKKEFELQQAKYELKALEDSFVLNYEDTVNALICLREKITKNDLTLKQIFDMHVKSILVKKDTTEVTIDLLPQILGDNDYLWCDIAGAPQKD